MTAGFPLEALDEAVAERRADGVWRACNGAMRRLLAALSLPGEEVALEVLVPDPDARASLARGETVVVDVAGEAFELHLVPPQDAPEGESWLLARPCETSLGLRLAAARMRALAQLAGSVVHDLANLFGAAIGVAETLQGHIKAEEDRQALVQLVGGVRRGAELATALERQLRLPRRRRSAARVDEVFADLQRLFGKAASQLALALTSSQQAALPPARIDAAVLLQLLLQTLFLGTQAGARAAALRAEAADASIAGGKPRRCVRIACELRGCDATAVARIATAFAGDAGWLRASLGAPEATRDLLLARLAIHRAGGALELRGLADLLLLEVLLPAAGSSPDPAAG